MNHSDSDFFGWKTIWKWILAWIIWAVFIPTIWSAPWPSWIGAYWKNDTLYARDVENIASTLEYVKEEKATYKKLDKQLTFLLTDRSSNTNVEYLTDLRRERDQHKVLFGGAYSDEMLIVHLIILTTMTILLCGTHASLATMRSWNTAWWTICVYVAWRWMSLYSIIFCDGHRKRYYYCNIDIDLASTVLQELRGLTISWLCAAFLKDAISAATGIATVRTSSPTADILVSLSNRVSDAFSRWTLVSTLLWVAFVPYSLIYWEMLHDGRNSAAYSFGAVTTHALWMTLWGAYSIPLFYKLQDWHRARANFITGLLAKPDGRDVEQELECVKEMAPLSHTQMVSAGFGGLISVIFPLLKLLFAGTAK